MATEIPERSNGQVILAEWFNILRTGLTELQILSITKTTNYTFSSGYNLVFANAVDNSVTITLPPASLNIGKVFIVIASDVTNAVSVAPNGASTIMGENSYILRMKYEAVRLITDGVDWYAI